MESKVILLAYINILPGFENEVQEAMITMTAETNKEPGSEQFLPYTRNDSPQTIVIYETYKNDEAFQLHRNTPHARTFFEFVKGKIVDDKIEVVFLTSLKTSEMLNQL